MEEKEYMLLDAIGNPIARMGSDEANPYLYHALHFVFQDAEKELKIRDAVSVVEIKTIERFGSGM